MTLQAFCPTTYAAAVSWRYRLHADPRVSVVVLPLACCSAEVDAAVAAGLLVADDGAGQPVERHVLVVAGTVTSAMAPAVEAAWAELPEPRAALAFGACATSGGPYWDSLDVIPGVQRLLPVAGFVPGCPPRPEALAAAIARLGAEVPA